jgi:uncharacterized protein (DUF302 family)
MTASAGRGIVVTPSHHSVDQTVMQAAPSIALDLPLKILVWEDEDKRVWLSYNSLAYLQERHGVPPELLPNLAAVEALAARAAE